MQRIILHIDMNSYFASVEQQDNPQWRGRVLGVCEHLGGIIIAPSVEAKRWGIKTAMPVWEARKLYPKIILTPTHPSRYRLYADRMVKVVSDYTDCVEQYSIDEVFVDVTKACNVKIPRRHSERVHPSEESQYQEKTSFARTEESSYGLGMAPDGYSNVNPFEEAVNISLEIKRRMKREVGDWLRCSIGIAENKLLAKIGSDFQKPDGLVVIADEFFHFPFSIFNSEGKTSQNHYPLIFSKDDLYSKLKLTDLPGIAARQERRLNNLGIKTLRDLRDYPASKLVAHFGIMGYHLHHMGQLKSTWKPKVDQEEEIKSIGHMYTLPKEYREPKFFVPVLYKLCEMVGRRLRQQQLIGNVLHFYVHDKNYEGFGQSRKLGYYMDDGREIFYEAMKIFEDCLGNNLPSEYKLVGVTVAGLQDDVGQQSLFEKDRRNRRVVQALDKINEKYGDFTVCRVPVQLAGKAFADSIGFGRIKEHVRLASFR